MFAELVSIEIRRSGQQEFSVATPAELKEECDNNHGCMPELNKMTIRVNETNEVISGVWASWCGLNRKSGLEVTIQTASKSPIHVFTTKRLALLHAI